MKEKLIMKTCVGNLELLGDENYLYQISFVSEKIEPTKNSTNKVLLNAKYELERYLLGELREFKIPLKIEGTDFQVRSWNELLEIPYGETISYKDQAIKLGGANYCRAVAGANNKNKLPIIIPCHRVVGSDGKLVGYAGGLLIKEKLLSIEQKNARYKTRHFLITQERDKTKNLPIADEYLLSITQFCKHYFVKSIIKI